MSTQQINSKTVQYIKWRNGVDGVGSGVDVDLLIGDAGEVAMLVSPPSPTDLGQMRYQDLSGLSDDEARWAGQDAANSGNLPESEDGAEELYDALEELRKQQD